MNHDQVVASVIGGGLFALSALSTIGGAVLAADVPDAVIVTVFLFLGGILVTVLGWMAVTLYNINGTTSSTNELVHSAVTDVATLEQRVSDLEDIVKH